MTPIRRDSELGGLAAAILWLLVATAIFVEQLSDVPSDMPPTWPLLAAVGWTAWALLLRDLARRSRLMHSARRRALTIVAVAAIAFFPPLLQAGWSMAASATETCPGMIGTSPEGLLLVMFRGVVIVLVATGRSSADRHLMAAASLFLVVASMIAVEHPAARVGLVAYALLGSAWLLAVRDRRDPGGVVAAIGVALVVALLGDSSSRTARGIAGFVPLSGGDGWAFPWARGGIGDGEDLIAAREKPTATGPVNSNVHVTSHKPSLYDLWTDLYGEPETPKKDKPERAFGLGPDETIAEETHLPDIVHAGREFTTARRGAARRKPSNDVAARGLVTVSGTAPVHLRLEAFDTFDGIAWRKATEDKTAASLPPSFVHTGGSWMRWKPPTGAREDAHEIAVGTLATPVLPLPAHTTGLRIDRIDRPDFFKEPQPGIVSLDVSDVPAGTRIEARSLAGGIDARSSARPLHEVPPVACESNTGPPWVSRIVRAWGLAAATTSWDNVARVVAALEHRCVLDHMAQAPPHATDTLEHFLCASRRGPDYCFAGAAVLLLRELGFDARLASGLYLGGDRRDPRSRKLVAIADDAHFWAEVRDQEGRWVPVEATPGYSLRRPTMPWWVPLQRWALSVGHAIVDSPMTLASTTIVAVAAWVAAACLWRALVDAAATTAWRLAVGCFGCCPLMCTWQLLEWRSRLVRRPRPRMATAREWYLGSRTTGDPVAAASLATFIRCFEESIYGPIQSSDNQAAHHQAAHDVVRYVSCLALAGRSEHDPRDLSATPSLPLMRPSLS
jgi:hypothetical protein